jgi:hypothetical protein
MHGIGRVTNTAIAIAAIAWCAELHAPEAFAQAPEQPKPAPVVRKQSKTVARALNAEQRHAIGVVNKVVGEARAIEDVATRVRLEARAAELLWAFDQMRARSVFTKAFDEADAVIDGSGSSLFGGALRSRLLADVLRRAYARDSAFAEKLLDSLDDSGDGIDYGFAGGTEATEQGSARLAIAASLASTNPSEALELARQSVDDAEPSDLATFLIAIRRLDRHAADAFYSETVARIAQQSGSAGELVPLQSYAIPVLEPDAPDPWRSFGVQPSPDVAALYLEAVWTAGQLQLGRASEPSSDPGYSGALYAQFASLLPAFEQYDPARVPDVRTMLASAAASLDVAERDRFDALTRSETPQSIAARAANVADASMRDALYLRAATLVASTSDDFREVESYASKVASAEARVEFLDGAGEMIALRLAGRRRYDDAVGVAGRVPSPGKRVRAYLAIATRLTDAGDRARAVEVLDLAEDEAEKAQPVEKSLSLARIASAYAGLDTIRGAEAMQGAIRAANMTLRLERIEVSRAADRNAPARPKETMTSACAELEPAFERIAAADYFRAMLLAQSIDDKTCSMSAQLAAARGALARAPRPASKKASD